LEVVVDAGDRKPMTLVKVLAVAAVLEVLAVAAPPHFPDFR
jgi:Tfp pilus assembly protein PilE